MIEPGLVSIIVPVYNVARFLPKCLDSIIGQTYDHIEIICVNDGSTDGSLEILNGYSQKDRRVKVVSQTNMGLSGARNTGLQYVQGQYLMFVDSDDWIEIDTCDKAITAATKYDADVVMWSYIREYSDKSLPRDMPWCETKIFEEKMVSECLHRRICGLVGNELSRPDLDNAIVTAWGKLYRSEIILSHNIEFVDTKRIGTEDALFNLYVFGYVKKTIYLNLFLNHYRKNNDGSLTNKYNSELFIRWQNLFEEMEQYIEANHLGRAFADALNNRVALSILGLGLNILASEMNHFQKIRELDKVLASTRYRQAYKALVLKWFPIHWKVFYGFAKIRFGAGVYLLLTVIEKIITH